MQLISDEIKGFLANSSWIRKMFEAGIELKKQYGNDQVFDFSLGNPDLPPPPSVKQALEKIAGQAGQPFALGYMPNAGYDQVRARVAAKVAAEQDVELSAGQVVMSCGAAGGINALFRAILTPGDEVVCPAPYFVEYDFYAGNYGAKLHAVPTRPLSFELDLPALAAAITPRTRAVLINSPCNPTGIVLEPERMRALAELGPMIVSDEIYHGLTYGDAEEHSILEYTDNAVVIGGFSKAYAMTGWRLGYLIVPRDLVRPMQALMQNFFLSTNSAVQKAGIAALTCADEDVARMHATYDERRRFLLGELKRLGFNIPVEPMGAFYMLINARHLGSSSMELAFDLLEKAHIGITPGIDFGSQTEGFLRLSYANSIDNLAEAMRRLEAYIRQR